jgi:hypothetical protein
VNCTALPAHIVFPAHSPLLRPTTCDFREREHESITLVA